MTMQEILAQEYSNEFDNIRKKQMITSFYKYGPAGLNYGEFKCLHAIENIQKRLEKYKETGNTEYLCDLANFAMLEFMYPSIKGAHYQPTDSGSCEVDGFGVNQIMNEER